jgi:hypothetical protein
MTEQIDVIIGHKWKAMVVQEGCEITIEHIKLVLDPETAYNFGCYLMLHFETMQPKTDAAKTALTVEKAYASTNQDPTTETK